MSSPVRNFIFLCLFLLSFQEAHAAACESRLVPSLEQQAQYFVKHTYAVHVTRQFPHDGVLKVDRMEGLPFSKKSHGLYFEDSARINVHFAIGGMVPPHPYGDWEEVPYGVLVDLDQVLPGAVNFFAQDLAFLGPFEIPPGSVVLIPEGDEVDVSHLKNVRLIRYHGPLRTAIKEFQKTHHREKVEMPPQSGFVGDPAYWNGLDVNSVEFADQIVKSYPHLEITSAMDSVFHGGWLAIISLCRRLDFKKEDGAGPLNQWRLLIAAVEHGLDQADRQLRLDSFQSPFKPALQKAILELRIGLDRTRHRLLAASDHLPPDGLTLSDGGFNGIHFTQMGAGISLLSDLTETEFDRLVGDIGFKDPNLIRSMKIEHTLARARTRPLDEVDSILESLEQVLSEVPDVRHIQSFLDWPGELIPSMTNPCRSREVRLRTEKLLNLPSLKPLVLKELKNLKAVKGVKISYPVKFDSIPEICMANFSRD